jgi:hypothetical protein
VVEKIRLSPNRLNKGYLSKRVSDSKSEKMLK